MKSEIKFTKKICQRKHAQNRFNERFNLNFSRKDRIGMINKIRTGTDVTFIKKESNRVSVFDVVMNNMTYRVVYDRRTKEIVTVFPQETLERDRSETNDSAAA